MLDLQYLLQPKDRRSRSAQLLAPLLGLTDRHLANPPHG